ncbi:M50 family metallopeptidase [Zhaonella formicivorans]|uniref:M50 family metallopeptidase n=1 Tax=Zhaonella formicivorans TaxID=2528593 RepID=UPI0010D52E0B|nr:M50 family metallopeptidase [Zhaonella formicivorans]
MRVGTIKGIEFRVNDFFLLLIMAYGMLGVFYQAMLIFTLVLVHESAHVFVARRGGIKVKEIELYPFGGVARLGDILEVNPGLEAKVALAGPMSNFFMLGLGFFLHYNYNWNGAYYLLFQHANLSMGLFNLLPALPLDGGRILRSFWSSRIGLAEATWKTSLWGKYWAVLIGAVGSVGVLMHWNDLNVVVCAVFIYLAAAKYQEGTIYIFLRYLMRKSRELAQLGVLPVRQLAATPKSTIKEVLPKFTPGNYHLIIILDQEGKFQGQLSEHQLIAALFEQGSSCRLGKLLDV